MLARETDMPTDNVHTSSQQIFTEHLPYTNRYYSVLGCLGYGSSCAHGACNLVRDVDKCISQVSAPGIVH